VSWQPIETAPKDGALIDVWAKYPNGGYRYTNVQWRQPEYDRIDGHQCWCEYDWHTTYDDWYWSEIEYEVTHWMPIPEPPK